MSNTHKTNAMRTAHQLNNKIAVASANRAGNGQTAINLTRQLEAIPASPRLGNARHTAADLKVKQRRSERHNSAHAAAVQAAAELASSDLA